MGRVGGPSCPVRHWHRRVAQVASLWLRVRSGRGHYSAPWTRREAQRAVPQLQDPARRRRPRRSCRCAPQHPFRTGLVSAESLARQSRLRFRASHGRQHLRSGGLARGGLAACQRRQACRRPHRDGGRLRVRLRAAARLGRPLLQASRFTPHALCSTPQGTRHLDTPSREARLPRIWLPAHPLADG